VLVPRYKSAAVTSAPSSDSTAAPQPTAPAKPPIHPIVGTWRTFIDVGVAAIYRFDNDGTFALTIKPLPRLGAAGPASHEAAGTWKVAGNTLSMTNTSSNSPISVVGETENATITSVDADSLVIDTTDRKGNAETLRFEHVEPFIVGRHDNANLIGKWQSAGYEMELLPSGDVVMTRAAWKGGKWSQQGTRLRLVLDPPYVRSAARRMADPSLTAPVEQEFVFRLSADNETLMLSRVGIPNDTVREFHRMPAAKP